MVVCVFWKSSRRAMREARSAVRSGSESFVKRVERVWRCGRMLVMRRMGRLVDWDFVQRLERVARQTRVIFSLMEERRIVVIRGMTSYWLSFC